MRICPFRLVGSSVIASISAVLLDVGGAIVPLSQPLFAHEMPKPHQTHQGHHESGAHSHGQVVIPPGETVPSVKLIAHPDAMQGWNLEVRVTNFAFAPERVNTKGNSTEGHAHLYVDGKKVTRLYGPWYYLGNLPPGQHTVRVTLSTNSHDSLIYNGKPIDATTTIQVPAGR